MTQTPGYSPQHASDCHVFEWGPCNCHVSRRSEAEHLRAALAAKEKELADAKDDVLRLHNEKMDFFEQTIALGLKLESYREALRELVACKDLKDEMEKIELARDHGFPRDKAYLLRIESEYKRRKPLAWEAARAALDTSTQERVGI